MKTPSFIITCLPRKNLSLNGIWATLSQRPLGIEHAQAMTSLNPQYNIGWIFSFKVFIMEPCNSLEDIIKHMEPSLLQGYNKFMQELILQGICYHNFTFDTLNRYLLDFNKEAYEAVCEKALSYYDTHATKEIKSTGI